ncbi:CDP-diacylglycerol--serine O-phosphatidyltransferase [Chitinimonas arctica]|uniref:CDP-diacylglycerol--serine O-phosphatidyltransferase n=1 Tax=Chitinimonas arctica TaxID=2594795 RepID=A0A516SEK3_9NEIS|nr:CDP-diacylglycerol--serine O-phosphatidyltransferase [Chitinimonas arctica]QDQ26592.1 CDP-diacylglycerol--serine O-phosphatidyltransferase [Chitinimonas arctica]
MRPLTPPGRARELRRQSIYLLPNSFTLAALFAGFYAIVQAMNRNFEPAAVAIFVAMVLDGMDGRVARMTHTQSAFGAEFDSLSDMVSFGVAPALVVYEWALRGLGKLGWIVAFIYCAGAALRLARFNTQLEVGDKRFFQGMPSPTAAAFVAGFVWVSLEMQWSGELLRWVALAVTLFAGLTMVSNVRYYSFKEVNVRKTVPFFVLLPILFVLVAIAARPPVALFTLFILYGLSGYALAIWSWLRPAKKA